jgi:hypothetical protein
MVKLFDTVSKKLAIPVYVVFAVGWIVFTTGFGLQLNELSIASGRTSTLNPNDPFYVPYYLTLAGGPFVIAFGLLHAALPSNLAGAIIGVVSTIFNNIYFVFVGFILSYGHLLIQLLITGPTTAFNVAFAGAILLTVSWGFSQILVVFFKQPSQTQRKNLWVLIFTRNREGTHCLSCTEVIRLLSIPAAAISIIGWCVYVGGIHNLLQEITTGGVINFISPFNNFAFWGSVAITPIGFLIALLQAGSSGSETIFGSLLSILNSFIIVCIGYVVTTIGQFLHSILQDNSGLETFLHNVNLIFGGGVVFLFFWTAMLALSRFYDAVHPIWASGSSSNQSQPSAPDPELQRDANTLDNSATSPSEFHEMTAAAGLPPPAYDYKQPSTVKQEMNIESV